MREPHFLVVDLEATCVDRVQPEFHIEPHEHEIIEIGAVLYNPEIKKVVDTFQSFVKPVIHPMLSEFCQNLTSIQQTNVDSAEEFKTVIQKFDKWILSHEKSLFQFRGSGQSQLAFCLPTLI